MNKTIIFFLSGFCSLMTFTSLRGQKFKLGATGYFRNRGVDVLVYDDIYPEGHLCGASLIMHGNWVATQW